MMMWRKQSKLYLLLWFFLCFLYVRATSNDEDSSDDEDNHVSLVATPTSSAPLSRILSQKASPRESSTYHYGNDPRNETNDDLTDGAIHEARLAKKKKDNTDRPTQPNYIPPSMGDDPSGHSSFQPVDAIDGTVGFGNDEAFGEEEEEEEEESPGLGKVGTALISVGGVLMIAGITGGIFVWRIQQQRQPPEEEEQPPLGLCTRKKSHHQDDNEDDDQNNLSRPSMLPRHPTSIIMMDHPSSPIRTNTALGSLRTENNTVSSLGQMSRQDGLDFNYSMEKLFHHARQPYKDTTSPSIQDNNHYPTDSMISSLVEDFDFGHLTSPLNIHFPSVLSQDRKIKINLVRDDTN
ncbi:uncharacterized protein BX664DRAFT_368376 [Halteromyces radiatus]|uniref:uncharacterized protein n=1 Tax=Halteromyces radiatus TaxID=101107 RepID=UPI002220C55A|nr:uncharacterized protein BX664DRAFT_368376 [Halteromyces radiatus]KAI8099450.1 hypothetical protein BX664DRAFT_368376 [Halteromyces radiatus]